jgi:hypothetical protein
MHSRYRSFCSSSSATPKHSLTRLHRRHVYPLHGATSVRNDRHVNTPSDTMSLLQHTLGNDLRLLETAALFDAPDGSSDTTATVGSPKQLLLQGGVLALCLTHPGTHQMQSMTPACCLCCSAALPEGKPGCCAAIQSTEAVQAAGCRALLSPGQLAAGATAQLPAPQGVHSWARSIHAWSSSAHTRRLCACLLSNPHSSHAPACLQVAAPSISSPPSLTAVP